MLGSSDGQQVWAVGKGGTIVHYTAQAGGWEEETSGTPNDLSSVFVSSDGQQVWTIGDGGIILHHAPQPGYWEAQTSGTLNSFYSFYSVFGSSDGTELWAAEEGGAILRYTPHTGLWQAQSSGTDSDFTSVFATSDGQQAWAVGLDGAIVHYTTQTGRWEKQISGTTFTLRSVSGSADGQQIWAVGDGGVIVHLTAQTGRWEPQTTHANLSLSSVFATSDGQHVWVVGQDGTKILHYTTQTGRWEIEDSGTTRSLNSVFGSKNGQQAWAAGDGGIMLHYTAQTGRWQTQDRAPKSLNSIFGSSDGTQVWAVGDGGFIGHYTARTGRWEAQASPTDDDLSSVFVSSDGQQVWAAGHRGIILYGSKTGIPPYIRDVRLVPKLSGAALQVHVTNSPEASEQPLKLALAGGSEHSFELGNPLRLVNSTAQAPNKPTDPWVFDFNPTDIDVTAGTNAHLQIELVQGTYKTFYDVTLPFDRYRFMKDHLTPTLVIFSIGVLVAALTLLLFIQPLWILYLYRKLKIYSLIEQVDVPVIGNLLQFLLKLLILPWFATHPRTLRAWVLANRSNAQAAWEASLNVPAATQGHNVDLDVPYVALPVELKDVSLRLLNQPSANDFETLLEGGRSVVQIVGPGGSGKTTLARHLGALSLAGGGLGAFRRCRLPIWIDEDFDDLLAVVKNKINSWYKSGEAIEEALVKALLESGLLLIIVDRVSERSPATQSYLTRVHRSVRCNALLITTRQPIEMEVVEQRFIYPQSLDSSTLLSFMLEIIRYYFRDSEESEERPFSTVQSQLELGKRLTDLIAVSVGPRGREKEIPMLPLPVVLFVSDAVALAKNRRSLDELPNSLPDVYARYLRRINPKTPGIGNSMSDGEMFRTAKALAKLALGADYIPKEFTDDRGRERIKVAVPELPSGIDPQNRLIANGVLISKDIGATTFLRFALDPVAEFLAAEAYFDECENEEARLHSLLSNSEKAPGFHSALLLTIQARETAPEPSSIQMPHGANA